MCVTAGQVISLLYGNRRLISPEQLDYFIRAVVTTRSQGVKHWTPVEVLDSCVCLCLCVHRKSLFGCKEFCTALSSGLDFEPPCVTVVFLTVRVCRGEG